MEPLDDFDPEGQQHDGSRAIIAILVIMALAFLWSTVIAPAVTPPPEPAKTEATTPGSATVPSKGTEPPAKVPELTSATPPKAGPVAPAKGETPGPEKPPPEVPPEKPAPALPPAIVTRNSPLFSACFTNQDARLARLVLLDYYRTPVAKRAALRAKRRDANADLSLFGLPLLGQEEATSLDNGEFESGDVLAPGQGPSDRPGHWFPFPGEEMGKALLWSEDAHSGERSVAITNPMGACEWRAMVQPLQSGATYELTCWVKLEAAEDLADALLPSVKLLQLAKDDKEVAWEDAKGEAHPAALDLRVPRAAGWQRLDAKFLAEPLALRAQILLRAPAGFKGQVWFDDVSLVKFGEPSLLLLPPRRAEGGTAAVLDERLFAPRRYELAAEKENEVAFRTVIPGTNLEVTKTFSLPKADDKLQRHVLLEVRFRNLGDQELKHPGYLLQGPGGLAADPSPASWKHGRTLPDERERKEAAAALFGAVAREASAGQLNVPTKAGSEVHSIETGSEKEKAGTWDEVGGVLWAAVASNYFAAILEPLKPPQGQGAPVTVESGGARCIGPQKENLTSVVQAAPFVLGPRGKGADEAVHRYRLFAGPKQPDLLASYGANYERLIPSRWLDPLTTACAWVLRASYFVIPNYGIAIIVLTALVRLVLHPLSKKSQTSMQKMQKLQPQVAEVREKYKTDKKRQQEETMKLYKTYGVNPMGGCLPIVLQIPIFIGLWRALQESIELRQAPFALWIQDLSQPDSLFGVVNVLPIASCAIMFIQQRLAPKAGDKQQQQTQKMMGYMMPVFLGWILYSLPSGLGLYFIASTLVGIAEQKVIKMHMDKLGDLKPVVEKQSKQTRKALFSRGEKRSKRKLF